MAKFFNSAIFILALMVLSVAQANFLHGAEKSKLSFTQLTESSSSETEAKTSEPAEATKGKECKCAEDGFKEFINKFALLFRAYGSKELVPEIHAIAIKIADFVLSFLAKEKPEEMNKFHSFLENSAKTTGNIVGKAKA